MSENNSTHKTKIKVDEVKRFLENFYNTEIFNFKKIIGGEGSQAFSYSVNNNNFIIRINKGSGENFLKDQFACENFRNEKLPIPKILQIGELENKMKYCISEMVIGVDVRDVKDEEFEKLLPNLFETLEEIHKVDISTFLNFGKFGINKMGNRKSWKEYLQSLGEHTSDLFTSGSLEKDFWDKYFEIYSKLIKFCPEEKYLLHGDFSGGNVISKNEKVAGVIDWEQVMIGDFLYDIAWMDFWREDFDYKKYYYEKYKNSNKNLKNYNERILCYQLEIGLDALSFYAYSGQREKCTKQKEKILNLTVYF
jgi:hygromycin-B 4-O-kinase